MRIIGVDLGTTNSVVAVVNSHGEPEILPNREGDYLTPSVVFFDGTSPVVGAQAKNLSVVEPDNVVQFVKRQMGNVDWRFVPEHGDNYTAEEIAAMILRRLKDDASAALGEPITHAVITVPAYFRDPERAATKHAGEMAGLNVVRIINEPTAAALAFGIGKQTDSRVVVYDLGGGTFDVTVLQVAPDELRVFASNGDRALGGMEWDNALIAWLDDQFVAGGGQSLLDDARSEQDLRERAEKAKIALSQTKSVKVVLSAGSHHATITLTRAQFEDLTRPLLERTKVILEETIDDAGLVWADIDKVLLVGGSTKMPAVVDLVHQVSGRLPSKEVHPDEVVALGAALQGLACAADVEERTTGKVSEETLEALEETGLGEITMTDVTAHSMGLVIIDRTTGHRRNDIVVDRGSDLPAQVEKRYFTSSEGQMKWLCEVTQGEEEDLRYDVIIGTGTVMFDHARPQGYPMKVRFSYDADGLIHVDAFDGQTNAHFGEVRIVRENNLTPEELAAKKQRISGLTIG